jgi:WD40 repeat protein
MKTNLVISWILLSLFIYPAFSQTGNLKDPVHSSIYPASKNDPITLISNSSGNSSLKTDSYFDPYFGWEGHYGSVNYCALANDEKELWTTGYDGVIRIWDWKTGKQLNSLTPYQGAASMVFANKRGTEVYAFGNGYEFYVYDVITKKIIRKTSFAPGANFTPVLSSDCQNMVMFDMMDMKIKVENINAGVVLWSKTFKKNPALGISDSSKYAAYAGTDKIIIVYNIISGDSLFALSGHTGTISALKFTNDNKYLVSASSDKTIKIWNMATGNNVMTLVGHSNSVSSIYFSPDGKQMISLSSDSTAKVWSTDNWNLIMTIKGNKTSFSCATLTGDYNKIITTGSDFAIHVWNGLTGEEENKFSGHVTAINYSGFIDNDSKVLTASPNDQSLKLWDSKTGSLIYTMSGFTGAIMNIAVSGDGKRVACSLSNNSIKIWDLTTETLIKTIETGSSLNCMCLNYDGSKLILSKGFSMVIMDCSTGAEIKNYSFLSMMPTQLQIDSTGNKLVASAGLNLKLINLLDGSIIKEMSVNFIISKFSASKDLSTIYFSGWYDNYLHRWNTNTGKYDRLGYTSHANFVDIDFCQKKTIVATAGTEPAIKLWDANTGKFIRTIYYENLTASMLIKFNQLGTKILATGTGFNNIRIYDVADTISRIIISGNIKFPGKSPGYIPIYLSGDQELKESVDSTGSFFFDVWKNGNYIIRPKQTGFVFIPDSITINNLTGNTDISFIMRYFLPQGTMITSPVPPNNYDLPCDVELKWQPAIEAESYTLKIGIMPIDLNPLYTITGITGTSYTIYGLPAGKSIEGSVWGINKNGQSGAASFNFTIAKSDIRQPVSAISDNYSFPDKDDILLKWSRISNAENYEVQLSAEKSFNTISSFYVQLRDTALNINNLNRNLTFFWRTRAKSGKQYSDWSEPKAFSIKGETPLKPILKSPETNSLVNIDSSNSSVPLQWQPVSNVISYNLQVATDKLFNGTIIYNNTINTTQATVRGIEKGKTYFWRVMASNYAGNSNWSDVWTFNPKLVKVDEPVNDLPREYQISQNYPNPFNPSTKIEYSLPKTTFVTIKIFNSIGKEINTLFKGIQEAGTHTISWEPNSMPTGVYFYRIEADKFSSYRKMLLIK